jgi:aspartyl-tRNA(Asn)/glutamyl-tRNA(Gln) amidotransferase subunit C
MAKRTHASISRHDIVHIAQLASLPLSDAEAENLMEQVGVTVSYVSQIQQLPTDNIAETSQVTDSENIFREDIVEADRMLSQEAALSNAMKTHNGFFVVDAVLG